MAAALNRLKKYFAMGMGQNLFQNAVLENYSFKGCLFGNDQGCYKINILHPSTDLIPWSKE